MKKQKQQKNIQQLSLKINEYEWCHFRYNFSLLNLSSAGLIGKIAKLKRWIRIHFFAKLYPQNCNGLIHLSWNQFHWLSIDLHRRYFIIQFQSHDFHQFHFKRKKNPELNTTTYHRYIEQEISKIHYSKWTSTWAWMN